MHEDDLNALLRLCREFSRQRDPRVRSLLIHAMEHYVHPHVVASGKLDISEHLRRLRAGR